MTVEIVGPDGPVPFLDLFQGRDELVVYKHMWYDGAPHQRQCEGCTTTAWHTKDSAYLNARGVSFAILTTGWWAEVAAFVEFMGYPQTWCSVRDVDEPVGGAIARCCAAQERTDRSRHRGQRNLGVPTSRLVREGAAYTQIVSLTHFGSASGW